MNPPSQDSCLAMLESISGQSRMALLLVDRDGRIVWANHHALETFPEQFSPGRLFESWLEECTVPETESFQEHDLTGSSAGGQLRRITTPDSEERVYRYLTLPLETAGPGSTLRSLTNISEEKKFKQHYVHNLRQLMSMKEIVDVLYESLETQEVIYLILVAVTSQTGFGFNRAFFLHVRGNRLRGRIGIGPSSPEEAHAIWSRIASLNLTSLRDVYDDLTQHGDVPDPRTQEIALRMDFDLSRVAAGLGSSVTTWPAVLSSPEILPGLLGALQRGKPACISSHDAGTDVDRTLFELLRTDAVAVLPLFVQGRLAGVIIADNFINRQPITQARLNVLKTFAGYAGVALERSHLYDELRESIVKLQTANENLKTNQQKLLQVEKLSAIGELAAYVSHEIRNPLVAIGGLARSLLKDRIENPETAETLDIIVSEVDRLERFLRDTLDFVKPRLACPQSVDLNGLVRDSTVTFKSQLGKDSIAVHFDLSKEPLWCLIDPELFHHALSNIVRNALEAVSSGGRIGISTRREGQAAVVWVGDTGPGIPAEVLPRIFDPFFTTKAEGTGLGLALASQNIRSLGGQLSLDPNPEYKTCFRLTIPLEGVVQKKVRQTELEETLPGGGHENRACCR